MGLPAGLIIGLAALTLVTAGLPNLHIPCAANYGDDAQLECTESGFDVKQGHGFTWMKNGVTIYTQKGEIIDAGNYSHVIIKDGVRLVVQGVDFTDAGIYSCSLRQRVSLEKVLHVEAKAESNRSTCSSDNGDITITISNIYPPNPVFGYVSCIQAAQVPNPSKPKHIPGTSMVRSSYADIPEFSDLTWRSDIALGEGNYTCTVHMATICMETLNVTCNIAEIMDRGFWWSWKGFLTIAVITVATIACFLCCLSMKR